MPFYKITSVSVRGGNWEEKLTWSQCMIMVLIETYVPWLTTEVELWEIRVIPKLF